MKRVRTASRHAKGQANPLLRLDLQRWRMRLVMTLIFGGFVAVTVKAAYLQGWQSDFLRAEAKKRSNRVVPIPAHRGMIVDRRGEPLAISTPVESLWVNPREAKAHAGQVAELRREVEALRAKRAQAKDGDTLESLGKALERAGKKLAQAEAAQVTQERLGILAAYLDVDAKWLQGLYAQDDKSFVYVKRQLPPETTAKALELKLAGLHADPEFRRFYPAGEVMAQMVGLTNLEDHGVDGLEYAYNTWLSGEPGKKRVIQDGMQQVVDELELLRLPKPGNELVLACNLQIQYLAYRELAAAVQAHRAKAGAIVVLDARTGEILALANAPSFNPNNRATYAPARARNRAATDAFEPGSTLKPFLMAAALDAQVITPQTRIDTGPGYYYIGDKRISDVHPKGIVSVAEALQVSSNVATARIAMDLKAEDYWRLLSQAGFGAPPGAGLPGETGGVLRSYESWRPIEKATMGFGHGISVSLLQLARAYTAFANDGVMPGLTVLKRRSAAVGQAVMSAATAREVRAMLERVTQDGGTAPQARVAGYRVAGKTGTAHKLVGGAYAPDKYIASFVGMAPASNPRVIVAVLVDEPSTSQYYGGQVAGPVFSRVMAGALRLMALPPDAPLDAATTPNPAAPVIGEAV